MKATDLHLDELLAIPSDGGVIQFGPNRIVLTDASAVGLLRKELIDGLGSRGARIVLSRFGFAQGWRAADSLRASLPWDSAEEWQRASSQVQTLLGQLVPDAGAGSVEADGEMVALWKDSFEAEQHLLHVGRSEEPVCWTLTGFVSGYMSRAFEREIYARETKCRAKGDAVCRVAAKTFERWKELGEDADVVAFSGESLQTALTSLSATLKDAEEHLRRHVRQIQTGSSEAADPSGIIAVSESMKKTLDLARKVARVDSSVLITGESGVGKERVARLIHEESERAARPFIAVNCGAITETLLESELFGHVRGSFTGASQDRVGLFEAAHLGTIFLDEIGEVPPAMQVKLLRVLQEREIRRVGESRSRKVDARVIAATNRDLAEEVSAGRFRDDLYYRLRVIELRIPPLRNRRQDILPIARRVLAQVSRRMRRQISGFTTGAADLLLRYSWPGNVRELQNAIEHAIVLAQENRIDAHDLPEDVRSRSVRDLSLDLTRSLPEVERDYILAVLEANGGNQKKTAEQLGIGTATLYRRLRSYGIPAKQA